ncbi:hypothetical protein [Clostridium novyi]|nr:hypothetical protein [Clostridium novyi]
MYKLLRGVEKEIVGINFWVEEIVRLYFDGYSVLEAIEIVKSIMR